MSYPAILLINRAWNLSGIVARGLETVSGEQGSDGLFLLNELLDFKSADVNLIPYFSRYEGIFITGVETYDIPNLLQIESMTFTMQNTVRYPMNYCNRTKYFGSGRVNNILSIPFEYHYERQLDGSRVFVYYLPESDYTFQISGKFGLTNVTEFQDLSLVYDGFYIAYLRYALAQYMCNEYDIAFAPEKANMLASMEKKLNQVSPPDLTMQKTNFINNKTALNWAQINLGKGWTT